MALELRRARAGGSQIVGRASLELDTPLLELRDVRGGGERGFALRQQEIAAETRLDLYTVADVAEVGDLLQKDDFHRCFLRLKLNSGCPNAASCRRIRRRRARVARSAIRTPVPHTTPRATRCLRRVRGVCGAPRLFRQGRAPTAGSAPDHRRMPARVGTMQPPHPPR